MRLDKNVFKNFDLLLKKIDFLEKKIYKLEAHIKEKNELLKNHITRIADNDVASSKCILKELSYSDLSPEEAFLNYNKKDYNFFLLDVSEKSFYSPHSIEESYRIELEFLEMRIDELPSKRTPIYVLSETGTRSILACEILHKYGFHNVNNISGGHKFWPGHKKRNHLKIAS